MYRNTYSTYNIKPRQLLKSVNGSVITCYSEAKNIFNLHVSQRAVKPDAMERTCMYSVYTVSNR